MSDALARRPARRQMRRHVLFAPGYDAMTVSDHLRLFRRECARFASVWSAQAMVDEPAESGPAPVPGNPAGGAWAYGAQGPNWTVSGRFEILGWADLASADMARSGWAHAKGSARALADMIASGTILAYFRANRRYGYFFVFTYILLAAFAFIAITGGALATRHLTPVLGPAGGFLAGLAAAAALAGVLLRWPARRMRLKQSLDLAEFSVDFVRGRHSRLDARIAAFAARLQALDQAPDRPDEIIICGHSLGATLAVCAVAQALDEDPAFGTRGAVRILTLGNTMAKFALHPAGTRLRAAARRVVATARPIHWLEIQSRDDYVSFYKVDPATLLPCVFCGDDTPVGVYPTRPLMRHVKVRQMMSAAHYRRRWLDLLRLHCQCFLASDLRAPFDFYAVICGPARFDELAARQDGPRACIDPAGAFIDPTLPEDLPSCSAR